MFSDRISVKAILIGIVGYLVLATAAAIIVVHFWMPSDITSRAQLARLAETSPTLLIWQNVIGVVLCVAAGFVTCRVSDALGLKNSLILGVLVVLYGVLGIYLHPTHPLPMQIAKVVAPIPLALFGGWLCLFMSRAAKNA